MGVQTCRKREVVDVCQQLPKLGAFRATIPRCGSSSIVLSVTINSLASGGTIEINRPHVVAVETRHPRRGGVFRRC
jgi:hypothetical protein